MQREPNKHQQWVMTCVGVSVVLGLIVGQFVGSPGPWKLRLISPTGDGPAEDLVWFAAAILLVVGGAKLTVTLHPAALLSLGILVLLATFGGPSLIARMSSKPEMSVPFGPAAVLDFVGAALFGAGLQRLISPYVQKTKPRRGGEKPE